MAKLTVFFLVAMTFSATFAAPQSQVSPDLDGLKATLAETEQKAKAFMAEMAEKFKDNDILKQLQSKLAEGTENVKKLIGPENLAKTDEIRAQIDTLTQNAKQNLDQFLADARPKMQEAGDQASEFASKLWTNVQVHSDDLMKQINKLVGEYATPK